MIVDGVFVKQVNEIINAHADILTPEIMKRTDFKIISRNALFDGIESITEKDTSSDRYGRKKLYRLVNEYWKRWGRVNFKAFYIANADDDDGKLVLSKLGIIINESALTSDILSSIGWLDDFIEIIKIDAMHEVGHIMDYVMSLDGMNRVDYLNRLNEETELKQKHFKWCDEQEKDMYKKTLEERLEIFKRADAEYYKLSPELRADTLAGIDRGKYIDLLYKYEHYSEDKSAKIESIDT
jgi:hypothetical protein